ncbi:MAG TPA: lytic transglycosylase domain-containing protein, partial [Acetobacteraceae bacterium]|nr:lytic transglycosylase domain-containing protein [Acetobacteraceae bacterium]
GQGRWGEAQSYLSAADPLAAKIVLWMRLATRTAPASGPELVTFLAQNPDWPLAETIARRAEEALPGEADDALVLMHFGRFPARTLDGAQRHADALTRAGRTREAAEVVRRGWAEGAADALAEANFLNRNAGTLTAEDHWRRFDRLAFARDFAGASRAAQALGGAQRGAAELRLALAADRPEGDPAAGPNPDIGVALERARLLRRRDRDIEAAQVWRAAEALQSGLDGTRAAAVWAERQVLARKLLRLGQDALAYRVAAFHGQSAPGEPRQEAEFLAGFIALRRLNDPAAAERHFAAIARDSASLITRARGAYWEGRALAARDETRRARERFAAAAAFPVAYYGQLGALALGEDSARIAARINAMPTAAPPRDRHAAFMEHELARVVVTLADLGDTRRARVFLLRLEQMARDATDRALAARLAVQIGRPDHAVWVARRAGATGAVLLQDGWPAPYQPPVSSPERAIILAITRQESNFDPEAVSSANARGLMQLLPSTAQLVARRLNLRHQPGMLTADPAHNMRLGAAYLDQMLERYGSLALAAAAYNAGPGRVDEWLGTYGDPRAAGVDKLDWIELIPFAETRNYVQRVIENVVIYRARDPAAAALAHPLAPWLRQGS